MAAVLKTLLAYGASLNSDASGASKMTSPAQEHYTDLMIAARAVHNIILQPLASMSWGVHGIGSDVSAFPASVLGVRTFFAPKQLPMQMVKP